MREERRRIQKPYIFGCATLVYSRGEDMRRSQKVSARVDVDRFEDGLGSKRDRAEWAVEPVRDWLDRFNAIKRDYEKNNPGGSPYEFVSIEGTRIEFEEVQRCENQKRGRVQGVLHMVVNLNREPRFSAQLHGYIAELPNLYESDGGSKKPIKWSFDPRHFANRISISEAERAKWLGEIAVPGIKQIMDGACSEVFKIKSNDGIHLVIRSVFRSVEADAPEPYLWGLAYEHDAEAWGTINSVLSRVDKVIDWYGRAVEQCNKQSKKLRDAQEKHRKRMLRGL